MIKYNSKKINLIKIFFFFCQIFPYIISPSCNDYSFCFECISDNSCIWDSNSCLNFTGLKIIKTQINKNFSPKKCFKEKDDKTKKYIDKY